MSLRIAMVSDHASPLAAAGGVDSGGQNVYVAQLARHLVRGGHQVDVYTRRDDPSQPEMLTCPDGYRVIHVPAGPARAIPKEDLLPYMDGFSRYVLARLSREPADLVHANFFMSALVAMRMKQALRIPFVVTFHALGRVRLLHQAEADRFPVERLLIEDRAVATADAIIAECPQDVEDQLALYDADRSKMHVVPCGFDRDELCPLGKSIARRVLGLDRSTPIVLQLGRLVPRKGVDDAIRGFARAVLKHGAAARMLVVGGDSARPDPAITPEIARLQNIARAEGVESRVTFVGRADRERLKYYYSAANVFISTPWYEPFGITPLEAMACATPVVGSNVGGIKYSVAHEHTGYLVPPHDPDAIAACTVRLLKDPELCRQMGHQALARVRSMFTWENVAESVEAVYDAVLDRRPAKKRSRRAVPVTTSSKALALAATETN
jgi:glycosyltransferase involved in cell wall biosynthesis